MILKWFGVSSNGTSGLLNHYSTERTVFFSSFFWVKYILHPYVLHIMPLCPSHFQFYLSKPHTFVRVSDTRMKYFTIIKVDVEVIKSKIWRRNYPPSSLKRSTSLKNSSGILSLTSLEIFFQVTVHLFCDKSFTW